jgi:hypothetical protein
MISDTKDSQRKMNIGILLPYFGQVPEWWALYLKGVMINPAIDFIIISDCIRSAPGLNNLICVSSTLMEIQKRASDALHMEVTLKSHKKLCDLKPMYGKIFSDLVRSYDFWGFGDLDLVYGRLMYFIAPHIQTSDIMSFRSRWLSGSLVLVRNIPKMNSLFEQSRIWREIVANPSHIGFGELCGMRYKQRLAGIEFDKLKGSEESFSAVVDRTQRSGQVKLWSSDVAKESLSKNCQLEWTPNGLFEIGKGREWAYYHMVFDKNRFFKKTVSFTPNDKFYISSTGFYSAKQFRSLAYPFITSGRRLSGIIRMARNKLQKTFKLL